MAVTRGEFVHDQGDNGEWSSQSSCSMAKKAGCGLCWVMLFGLGRPGEPRRMRMSNPEQEACREVA